MMSVIAAFENLHNQAAGRRNAVAARLRHAQYALNYSDDSIRQDLKRLHVAATFGDPFTLPFEENRQIPDERHKATWKKLIIGDLDSIEKAQERFNLLRVHFTLTQFPQRSVLRLPRRLNRREARFP